MKDLDREIQQAAEDGYSLRRDLIIIVVCLAGLALLGWMLYRSLNQ